MTDAEARALEIAVQRGVFGSTVIEAWPCYPNYDGGGYDPNPPIRGAEPPTPRREGSYGYTEDELPVYVAPESADGVRLVPSYASDPRAWWQVVERLREQGWMVTLTLWYGSRVEITLGMAGCGFAIREHGESPGETVCRAALAAVGDH